VKRFVIFSFICFFSAFAMIACKKDQGARAGGDGDYQPRPAATKNILDRTDEKQEMRGELLRVDASAKTISIRLENGLVQTFRIDDATDVQGLKDRQAKTAKSKASTTGIKSLAGKEGSEITVRWQEDNQPKMATEVEVTQLATAKNTRGAGRR